MSNKSGIRLGVEGVSPLFLILYNSQIDWHAIDTKVPIGLGKKSNWIFWFEHPNSFWINSPSGSAILTE